MKLVENPGSFIWTKTVDGGSMMFKQIQELHPLVFDCIFSNFFLLGVSSVHLWNN
jgi:hypothetical protein